VLPEPDELQFTKLFANIRLRRQQGVLIFLSCNTEAVERFLIEKITGEFSSQFPIAGISIPDSDYVPLQTIFRSGIFSVDTLYIICKFPFEDYYKNPSSFEDELERLTRALNLGREYFSSRALKCVIICPPEVEDRIKLKAPDFYHFTHFSGSFTDDQEFHRDIENLEPGGQEEQKRIEFLQRVLKATVRKDDKAGIHFDLGEMYNKFSDFEKALFHWQRAETIYKKSGNEKKYAAVLGNIGLVYSKLGQSKEASKYLKDSERIYQLLKLPMPENFINALSEH